MPYPDRRAWQFRNVTGSFNFLPTLDSVSISDAQDDLATFSCEVVDEERTLAFANEDKVWVKYGGTRIFAGHIKTCTESERSEIGPRSWKIEAQDFTAKLDDSIIDHPHDRAAEPLADRVAWILSFLNYGIDDAGVNLPSEDADQVNYDGQSVSEALQQLCDDHRLSMYVDFDNDEDGTPSLHLFRTETITAPFSLDDDGFDLSDSFPYQEYERSGDSVDLATAIYVQGEKAQTWVEDSGAIATYGRQERAVNDSNLKTSRQRDRAGERALAENDSPTIDGHLVCWEPGLRAGMTFLLSNALWNRTEETYIVTNVTIEAVDPHDSNGKAYLHTEIQFSDKRKAKAGGSHRRETNKLSRRRHPSLEDVAGDACTEIGSSDTADWVELSPDGASLVFATGAGWGAENLSHPFTPCGVGPGAWLHPFAAGGYYALTAPAAGGQLVAKLTAFGPGATHGNADGWDVFLFDGSVPPMPIGAFAGSFGAPLAHGMDDAQDITIPAGLIPWGGDFCIVVWPAWHVDAGGYVCGVGGGTRPEESGQLGCGEYSGFPSTLSLDYVVLCDGAEGVLEVAAFEAPDGSRSTFTLTGWDGTGRPQVFRNGVLVVLAGSDPTGGTVTLNEVPRTGDLVTARYHVGATVE